MMLQPTAGEVQDTFMRDAVRMTNLLEGRYYKHAEALYMLMAAFVAQHEKQLKQEHVAIFKDISRALSMREPHSFERLQFDLQASL